MQHSGRKSPYTITFTNHHAGSYAYNGRLTFLGSQTFHALGVRIETEKLQNNAETYRELKNDAGSSYYEYYHDGHTIENPRWTDCQSSQGKRDV